MIKNLSKKKKSTILKNLLSFTIYSLLISAISCTSTALEEKKEDLPSEKIEKTEEIDKAQKEEKVLEEKIEEPVVEDSPDVAFVKELQNFLAENDLQGAIVHFESIPEELKDDTQLKLLLGALLYSDKQFDKAIETANEVLSSEEKNMEALELLSLCNHAKGDKKAYRKGKEGKRQEKSQRR